MSKTFGESEPGAKAVTPSKIITQSELELFCAITGTSLPLFLSEAGAREGGWQKRLIPATYTYPCSVGLIMQTGVLDDVIACLGADEMKAFSPVYVGDSIHVEVELLSKRLTRAGDKGVIEYQWNTINQEGKTVAQGKMTEMYRLKA
ncbi:MAG: MaoC/PaaZ C-terminal domain-containing protein [Dehalococcoidales bacterium]|nr:MaoC/PaaZ C-terminal domain-containing protein [Dehalococcoidales bacterium]